MKNRNFVRRLAFGAMIGALYAAVSIALAPLSFGNVQIRIAEALTLLAILFPEAIMGLTLGCFLTNLVGNFMGVNIAGPLDILVGTLATFLAALLSYRLRNLRYKGVPWAATIPPILINALFIGLELTLVIGNGFSWSMFGIFFLEVGLGQLVAVVVLGIPLLMQLEKNVSIQRIINK